jgi:hypothetical protein
MRRTRRKGTSKRRYKGTSKRRYKGTSKRTSKGTSKRVARKQSGGVDMLKLQEVVNQRSLSSNLAAISAKKAEEFKKQINLL